MKKKIFKTLVCACGVMMVSSLTTPVNADSVTDSVKVNKVNLDKNFALGMDLSSIIALEKGGVKYYDGNGNEKDIFKICNEGGANYVRVRIIDNEGNTIEGVCSNNDLETNEVLYGIKEESLILSCTHFKKNEIKSIEEITEFSNKYGYLEKSIVSCLQ